MEAKPNKLLTVTGTLMVIFGILVIIFGIIGVIVTGVIFELVEHTAPGDESLVLLNVACICTVLNGIVMLIAGVLGTRNAAKPAKARLCIVFGIFALTVAGVVCVLGQVMNIMTGGVFSVFILVTCFGLIIPVIYLIGAFQNKKLAQQLTNGVR